MKRGLVVVGIGLLLMAVVLVAMRRGPRSGTMDPAGGRQRVASTSGSGGEGKYRLLRGGSTEFDAARRLRQLIDAGPAQSPGFEAIESIAARLGDGNLAALRSATATARPDSLAAWVRCAVFAEIARRDPARAMEWLTTSEELFHYDEWGLRQAWFSTFRGMARTDPAAAMEGLDKFAGAGNRTGRVIGADEIDNLDDYMHFISRDDTWRLQAAAEVFAQLARDDPGAAWAAVPEEVDITGQRDAALQGFFRGLQGGDEVRLFVARWEAGLHAVELVLESLLESRANGPRISNPGARPRRETVTVQAALALEAVQPGAGRAWFRGANSGGITVEQQAQAAFFDGFARVYPQRALAVLEEDAAAGSTLLGAFLRHHPDRAAESFAHVDDPNERYEETLSAISNAAFLRLEDLFPAPGRSNRLPDWQQRYEDLLLVVDAGGFDPGQQANLVRLVSEQFAPVIPEARTAAGLPH